MSDQEEAQALANANWWPVSNRFCMVAKGPDGDPAEALAREESKGGGDWGSAILPEGHRERGKKAMYRERLKHWQRLSKYDCVQQYARMYGQSKTVNRGVYQALKAIRGAYNRG